MSPSLSRAQNGRRRTSGCASASIETLEQRKLLSSYVSVVNNVLTFTGTVNADYFQVNGDSANLMIFYNGVLDCTVPNTGFAGMSANLGAGNDKINFNINYETPTTVSGGDGNDTIYGINGPDLLMGDNGADSIMGMADNDTLIGGADNDSLYGGGGIGDDSCDGGDGNDYMQADYGNDTYIGGNGNDTVDYTACTEDLTLSLDDVANDGDGNNTGWGNADNLTSSLETILSGSGNDILSGEGGPNYIQGGNGNDSITGVGGNDSLSGNAGNDTISGGSGNDSIYGQAGNDSLIGDSGNDYLEGNAGYDYLLGGSDNDTLHGADGTADTLDGAGGTDSAWRDLNIDNCISIENYLN